MSIKKIINKLTKLTADRPSLSYTRHDYELKKELTRKYVPSSVYFARSNMIDKFDFEFGYCEDEKEFFIKARVHLTTLDRARDILIPENIEMISFNTIYENTMFDTLFSMGITKTQTGKYQSKLGVSKLLDIFTIEIEKDFRICGWDTGETRVGKKATIWEFLQKHGEYEMLKRILSDFELKDQSQKDKKRVTSENEQARFIKYLLKKEPKA